ncbi:hypothetical protein [Streptosporangium sp. NPDC051022]|uniref:hypothetical protein n=1 Tax=Streptosporangium sp. NPDC051022 TaxID=3155752 RepID=UPI0034136C54
MIAVVICGCESFPPSPDDFADRPYETAFPQVATLARPPESASVREALTGHRHRLLTTNSQTFKINYLAAGVTVLTDTPTTERT